MKDWKEPEKSAAVLLLSSITGPTEEYDKRQKGMLRVFVNFVNVREAEQGSALFPKTRRAIQAVVLYRPAEFQGRRAFTPKENA